MKLDQGKVMIQRDPIYGWRAVVIARTDEEVLALQQKADQIARQLRSQFNLAR